VKWRGPLDVIHTRVPTDYRGVPLSGVKWGVTEVLFMRQVRIIWHVRNASRLRSGSLSAYDNTGGAKTALPLTRTSCAHFEEHAISKV